MNSYDAVGRVTAQTQGFLANDGVTWKDFASSRSYDLVGHALTQGYPSTRNVIYTYDAGGRLASAAGDLGGTSYTYADKISYTPAGLLTKERFGTTTNLYHNLHYNNRLQLVDVRLGDSSTDEYTWTRGKLLFYYGTNAVSQSNVLANSTDNNGNILRQVLMRIEGSNLCDRRGHCFSLTATRQRRRQLQIRKMGHRMPHFFMKRQIGLWLNYSSSLTTT